MLLECKSLLFLETLLAASFMLILFLLLPCLCRSQTCDEEVHFDEQHILDFNHNLNSQNPDGHCPEGYHEVAEWDSDPPSTDHEFDLQYPVALSMAMRLKSIRTNCDDHTSNGRLDLIIRKGFILRKPWELKWACNELYFEKSIWGDDGNDWENQIGYKNQADMRCCSLVPILSLSFSI